MTEEIVTKASKYESNKNCVIRYYKKRYENDEEFRKRENERISKLHKDKYRENNEYRAKRYECVVNFRARQRQLKIEQKQKDIDEMIAKQKEAERELCKLQKFLKI